MTIDRREFLAIAGTAAVRAAVSRDVPRHLDLGVASPDGDIDSQFASFMRDLGCTPSDGGGSVTFIGRDPILRSHFRIATSMAIPAAAVGVGAAAIWKDRTGQGQDVHVDLREAVYNVNPIIALVLKQKQMAGLIPRDDPIPASFTFVPGINGRWYQAPWGLGNPFSFAIYETKDGRYVTITGAYPHLTDRALDLLDIPPKRDAIAHAIKKWNAAELESAMVAQRVVGGIHRTAQEWAQEPEGKHLAGTPLIEIVKIGDGPAVPYTPNPRAALSGVRALALTHVIAGSCVARTLAEHDATILHVARDQSFEHPVLWTDVNVGMRSTFLDLTKSEDKAALEALVPKADVFIESFSGRAIERLGFGVEEVAKKRPGIIYISLRAFSWDGPWRERPGFDMEALTVTGYTMAEGSGGHPAFSESYAPPAGLPNEPAFPPTLVLNDYIAGYLGAAGVLAALRRRAREGGSYHVRVSLSRAAMWYASLGFFPTTDFDATAPQHRMIPPEVAEAQTPYGKVRRLAPLAKLSKTPGRWRDPFLVVRGSDLPTWSG
ncbi:MAG TPA: CoA transferase [Gemmatimonadaceae bacterium]|jgi:crotonobetainyl-CoA:carnitine CoA-transferase CaiB-like acyl-CoA transferase